MSISVGMIGEGYTIVATDSRVTNIVSDTYRDMRKTFMTKFGWVADSGGVGLVTTFFERYLNSHKIISRNDIYKAWLIAIKQVETFAKDHADLKTFDMVQAELSSSQSVYSLNYFKNGKACLGIEAIDFAYNMRKVEGINSIIVNPPEDIEQIRGAIDKYTELAKSTKDINESIYLVACLVDDISKFSNWINNIIDYGISFQILPNEILLLSIHENAETIKALYKSRGEFLGQMMVRGTIPRPEMKGNKIL